MTILLLHYLSANVSNSYKPVESTGAAQSTGLSGITVDKSVEFSYEELAKATNDFNMANKIGKGGFGSVYYAELRGEVCNPQIISFDKLTVAGML